MEDPASPNVEQEEILGAIVPIPEAPQPLGFEIPGEVGNPVDVENPPKHARFRRSFGPLIPSRINIHEERKGLTPILAGDAWTEPYVERVIKEFYCNLLLDSFNPNSAKFGEVFLRKKVYHFTPQIVNEFLGTEDVVEDGQEITDGMVIQELTANHKIQWRNPKKAIFSPDILQVKGMWICLEVDEDITTTSSPSQTADPVLAYLIKQEKYATSQIEYWIKQRDELKRLISGQKGGVGGSKSWLMMKVLLMKKMVQISFFSLSNSWTFSKSRSSPPFPHLIQSKILSIGKSRVTTLGFAESAGEDKNGGVVAVDEVVMKEEAEGGDGSGGECGLAHTGWRRKKKKLGSWEIRAPIRMGFFLYFFCADPGQRHW
ncbi:hypothetical protein DH2020_015314 [Rehmannia glutinosa]|uniref:Uncharacterized protein n=1 Tax=Rehmannia glutinosa TaxID=99300 RepID=A0ABR0WSE5_REHGL